MIKRKYAGVLLPCLLLGAAGLAHAQEIPPPPPPPDEPPPPPDGDPVDPPPAGGICFSAIGQCEALDTPCGDASEGLCVEGNVCVAAGAECATTSDCGDGLCMALGGECAGPDDCEPGWGCQGGTCVMPIFDGPPGGGECDPADPASCEPPQVECGTEMDCAGFPCVEGFCMFPNEPPPDCDPSAGDCPVPPPGGPGGGPGDDGPVGGGGGDGDGSDDAADGSDDAAGDGTADAEDAANDAKDAASSIACSVKSNDPALERLGLLAALGAFLSRRRKKS